MNKGLITCMFINLVHPVLDDSQGDGERITPFLGTWKGRSITKRSGVYGSTLSEADTVAVLDINDQGQVVQDISSTSDVKNVTTNVHWVGEMSKNLVTFAEGYQMTLLPGGMYMGCPCDVAKSVAELKSFHLEFCWTETRTHI
ncbi:hypothetical protein Bca52824_068354 [Brassica carinata]|uniref:Uncharacterized protein n=1 Tax=Brassica carinata TaxID=52824 RepID=A0A8X7Q0L9_BRACI|nr:hypothetical protein Bca52824_068354 [Brassica carinata]